MPSISWELTAIAVARYAHELRIPVADAIDKLLEDVELSPIDVGVVNRDIATIRGRASTTGEKDSRYLSVMKRAIMEALIKVRSGNKAGDVRSDENLLEFYHSSIGSTLLQGLYKALERINNKRSGEGYGVAEERELPFSVITSKDPNGTVPMFAQPDEAYPLPGIVIRGTEDGLGEVTTTEGMNKLRQREYTDADGLSNESSTNPSTVKITYHSFIFSVPPGSSNDADYAQWYNQVTLYVGEATRSDGYTTDDRPCDYEHCQFFANLKTGSYKLICEAYVDPTRYPFVLKTHDNENPYVALVSENNEILVKKSMNQSYCPTISEPLFNGYNTTVNKFYHEEYPFVVDNDISVGFISKIYAPWNNNIDIRFQIVNADVVAEPFTVITQYETFSGVTCWEPYEDSVTQVVLHFTVTNELDGSTYTEEVIRSSPLMDDETIVIFTNNTALEAAVSEGAISLSVEEVDIQGKSGTASTVWLR